MHNCTWTAAGSSTEHVSSRLFPPPVDQIIASRFFLGKILDFRRCPGNLQRVRELPGLVDYDGNGYRHEREKTLYAIAVRPLDPPLVPVFRGVVLDHLGIERFDDRLADRDGAFVRKHHDKVISSDVAHKGIGVATSLDRFIDYFTGNPDHFTRFGIAVPVGKRLEIVQIRITEGELPLQQTLLDFPFYGYVARQAGQGTGIEAYLFQFL